MIKAKENLNEVAKSVCEGKITPQQGLDLILKDIMNFPLSYGLTKYDDELKSDLVLRLLERGPSFFIRYKGEIGEFSTYLKSLIKYQIREIYRLKRLDDISSKDIEDYSKFDYESSQSKYEKEEFSYRLSNFKPYFPGKMDKIPYASKNNFRAINKESKENLVAENINNYKKEDFSMGNTSPCFNFQNKYQKKTWFEKTALILALKSSYYLTDEHIEGISNLCKIPKSKLIEVVEELKDSIAYKEKKIQMAQRARDRSYQLHRKAARQLEDFPKSDKKNILEEKYKFYTKKWLEKNKKLKEAPYFACPTNKKIAEVLGLCERQVGYYLQKADETIHKHQIEAEEIDD
ncbi:MAG: hypothetical protein K6F15_11280 [Treponema sp.]|nr:hypothetical protein [Treponema sp.]